MFPDACFTQVMGVKTGAYGAFRFARVSKGRDLFCRLCDWCDNSLVHHVLKGFSICYLHSIGTFLQACWTGGMKGSRHIVQAPGMFPVVSNEAGNVYFNATLLWTLPLMRWSWEGAILCTLWSWKGATCCSRSCDGPTKWSWKRVTGCWWSWKGALMTGFNLWLLLCGIF